MLQRRKVVFTSSFLILWVLLLSLFTPFFSPGFLTLASAANPVVTLVGTVQSKGGCSGDWQPDCSATVMNPGVDGIYRITLSNLPAGHYEYKVTINQSWSENYGAHAVSNGGNISLNLTAPTAVNFYYDPLTHWITDNVNSRIATAAGSFQSALGCSGNWQPSCLKSWLEDIDGDGIYTFETTSIPAGNYEFKVALNEGWNENYGQNGAPGGSNIAFNVPNKGTKVTFKFNAATKEISVSSGHRADNNVEYNGLAHDSRDSLYRVPFGAVNPGTAVTLRLRTFHKDVTAVTLRLYDTATSKETRSQMKIAASNVSCYNAALEANGDTCDYWQGSYLPSALGTVYYRFIVQDGTATAYYADSANRYDGIGVATSNEQDNGFRIHVVDPSFKIVPWMQNGVMYQIFPDRFRNGDPDNDPKSTDPRYDYPAPANATPQQLQAAANAQIVNKNWNDLPEGYCFAYESPTQPCVESAKGRDYFGGDLKGVDDKLDYLKSVGISIIYLNPIFASGSNHGYDTRDYLQISPYFGSSGYFKKLVKDANDKGIKLVLDGVFNHMSSDSPFFDRYHHYSSVGACESAASPYRSWFIFRDVAPGQGPCAGSDAQHSATYDGWAGFDSIPVIVKKDPADQTKPYAPVAQLFYSNSQNSVAGYWLNMGASGWRFDVMTDPSFPVSYWKQLRTVTLGVKPDETLIAEAWHWYDNLPLTNGDQADTAMGYRFRNAVLGLLGAVDNKGFPQEDDPNLPVSVFAERINSMREDYADATYYTFQNLLDSHDTKRVLWSLTPGKNNREDKEFNLSNLAIGKKRQSVAALVQMTVPGTPAIYYGDEVGVTGADDPDDRRTFPWNNQPKGQQQKDPYFGAAGDHNLLDLYKKLTSIRQSNPVLRQGKLTFLLTDDASQTLAYGMRTGNSVAVIVINRNENKGQTVTIPLASYLRDGVSFNNVLGSSLGSLTNSATSTGRQLSVSLDKLGAAILIANPGQDLSGPTAPTELSSTVQNGRTSTVTVSWTGNSDSASYNVYRSPVQGGGYIKIGTSTTTNYTDSTVSNGTTYYYVVKGVDASGNEGDSFSGEVSASPAFPIGYAVLQWPKTISQKITSNYNDIYGQVYIAGITDSSGDPLSIFAQSGYGAAGTTPASWTTWLPMSFNTSYANNYEYKGQLRADVPGNYNYLVRFSDDGGLTWVYGDQDGYVPGGSGTNQPGLLSVTPSTDSTAPASPALSIDYNATSLSLSWNAVTDPDDSIAEYRIYRGTNAGGEAAAPLAIVPGNTTGYLDTGVGSGQAYYYYIKAFDTSLNASARSVEVHETARAKIVHTTFRVKVPAYTPAADTIYISGSPEQLCNYCGGNTPGTMMAETAPGSHIWQITLDIADGTAIQYKYTRGSYDYVEEWGSIKGFTNRVAAVHANSPSDLTQIFDDTSDTYPDDNHKSVQNWRDALVTVTAPGAGSNVASPASIKVSFNWDVKPDGPNAADFSTAVVVTRGGTQVSGTITHDSTANSLLFTPSGPLSAGTYTVTVDHVVSLTLQNDGVKIRIPYVFTFTVS